MNTSGAAAGVRDGLRAAALRAGLRAALAAVFLATAFFATNFFATAFFVMAFRAVFLAGFAFALAFGRDFVFAETLEVARFAVFFAADFAVFFAADFVAFFFPAGFAIPKLLLLYALCTQYRVGRASTFLYSDFVFHYNQCGEPQIPNNPCASPDSSPFLIVLYRPCPCHSSVRLSDQNEAKWNASKPASYYLRIEMKGDRVDKEQFETTVRAGAGADLEAERPRHKAQP